MMDKNMSSGARLPGFSFPTLQFISCVTKLFNLTAPQFPHM